MSTIVTSYTMLLFKNETQCNSRLQLNICRQTVWSVNVTCYAVSAVLLVLTTKRVRIFRDLLAASKGLRNIGFVRGRAIIRCRQPSF
jgi:hypothetical protein